jgi:hypothetical protein
MEDINVGSPTDEDWKYLLLNTTGKYKDYTLNFTFGEFPDGMEEQAYMDEVHKELIEWRTAVAVKRVYDKLHSPDPDVKSFKPPKPYFKLITDTGIVKIGFTDSVWVVPDMKMVNNGTIYLSDLTMLGGKNFKRDLVWQKEAEQFPVL